QPARRGRRKRHVLRRRCGRRAGHWLHVPRRRPLVIRLRVNRVVADSADMNADGTIRNWQELVNKGVLSRFAVLTMPAFDVDYNSPAGPYFPERDHLTFSGHD